MDMPPKRHLSIELGSYDTGDESLEETAKYVMKVLNTIEHNSGNSSRDFCLNYVFSSRGSLPFFIGLQYITQQGLKPTMDFQLIPHIYSLENLLEIVSDYGSLQYDAYEPIIMTMYSDIASHLTKKLSMMTDIETNPVITDWDEVIKGRNISERIKVYNMLHLNEDHGFYIASFIGNGSRSLERKSVRTFKKIFKRSPDNYATINIILKNPIHWSDNEDLYKKIGIIYPCIGAPDTVFIRNLLRKDALPQFYLDYFTNYNALQAQAAGHQNRRFSYRLIPRNTKDAAVLEDKEMILAFSEQAFRMAIDAIPPTKFKLNFKPEYLRREEPLGRIVYVPHNKRITTISRWPRGQMPSESPGYRNPFVMIYDPRVGELKYINRFFENFLRSISAHSNDNTTMRDIELLGKN